MKSVPHTLYYEGNFNIQLLYSKHMLA